MKKYILYLSLFIIVSLRWSDAGEVKTNHWGPATNQIQISISFKGEQKQIKTNEPFNIVYRVKNNSTNEAFHFFHATTPDQNIAFSFNIFAPSGKESLLNVSPTNLRIQQAGWFDIPHGQTREFDYKISDILKFDEIGAYQITAKIWMSLVGSSNGFEVISPPLSLTIAPGAWVPPPAAPLSPKRSMRETGGASVLKGFISTIPKTNHQ